MAFYCEACKVVYPKLHANCPKCGDQLVSDNLTDDILLSRGYSLRGAKKNGASQVSTPSPTPTTATGYKRSQASSSSGADDKTFNEIRAMFESGNNTTTTGRAADNNTVAPPATPTATTTPRPKPQKNTTANTSNTNTETTSHTGSFFDNPDDLQFRIPPVEAPTITRTYIEPQQPIQPQQAQPQIPVQTNTASPQPTYNDNLFDDTAPAQPRVNSRRNSQAFFNALRNGLFRLNDFRIRHPIHIPWYWIRRFLPYILVICAGIVIWVSRVAILSAITEVIVGLIPIALLVGGVVYLIRRLFRP